MKEADRDGDGKVSMAEMHDEFLARAGPQPEEDRTGLKQGVERTFTQSDANGDGHLDMKELGAFIEMLQAEEESEAGEDDVREDEGSPKTPEEAIKDLDTDGDGKLSLAEVGVSEGGDAEDGDGESIKQLFQAKDANGDGHLDLPELTAFMEQEDEDEG